MGSPDAGYGQYAGGEPYSGSRGTGAYPSMVGSYTQGSNASAPSRTNQSTAAAIGVSMLPKYVN